MARISDAFTAAFENTPLNRPNIISALDNYGKGVVPSNIRLFASTMLGSRAPVDETYFTPEELDVMRATAGASVNRHNTKRAADLASIQEDLAGWSAMPQDQLVGQKYERNTSEEPDAPLFVAVPNTGVPVSQKVQELVNQRQAIEGRSPSIQYEDYGQDGKYENYLNNEGWVGAITSSFTDPTYRASTSIGRARLNQTPEGHTVIEDTYDWNYGKDVRSLPIGEQLKLLGSSMGNLTQFGNMMGNYLVPDTEKRRREVRIDLGKVLPPKEAKK